MTIDVALDCGLAALALVMGGWIIAARGSFAATVGFVAYGLLLTLAWVRLDAIDVALMEGAIGSGLTGALLLRASSRLRASETPALAERPSVSLASCGGASCSRCCGDACNCRPVFAGAGPHARA